MLENRLRKYVHAGDIRGAKFLYKKLFVPVYTLASIPVYDITSSSRYHYTWFRIPKNATHSIMKVLNEAAPPDTNSSFVPYFRKAHRVNLKFCFIRNPWDRLVSVYCNKVEMKLMFSECWDKGFDSFIDFISQQNLRTCDAHLRLQTALFPTTDIDFIGRMERFEEDILKVMEKLVIKADIPREGRIDHADYRTYYSPFLRDKVAHLYEADIRYGGYSY